jgi:hypothetical protein
MSEPEAATPKPVPSRAEQRRREEFERLCSTGYTVCCGGGPKGS